MEEADGFGGAAFGAGAFNSIAREQKEISFLFFYLTDRTNLKTPQKLPSQWRQGEEWKTLQRTGCN